MLTEAAAAAGTLAAVLAATSGVVAVQGRAAYRRLAQVNRGRDRAVLSRSGRYQPTGATTAEGGAEMPVWILGDSIAAGLGASAAANAPSALLGQGLADAIGRPVHIRNAARVGAGASSLADQIDRLRHRGPAPEAVLIVVGSNDASTPWRLPAAARTLGDTVAELTKDGTTVLVATCPSLRVVTALPRPARWVLHGFALLLARLQTAQVTAHGGHAVALHRRVSPAFAANPALLGEDGFHPGDAGYRVACDVVLAHLTHALSSAPARPAAGAPSTVPAAIPAGASAGRLDAAFARGRSEGRALLGGCLPAGFPTVRDSRALLAALAADCDFVEVSVPSPDAYLDGPVMRAAYDAALDAGFRTQDVIPLIRDLAATGTPVLAMAYWHSVAAYGPERLADELAAAGAAGLVLPDLPAPEARWWSRTARRAGLHSIVVASPHGDPADTASLIDIATGAVYLPATGGRTGGRTPLHRDLPRSAARLRAATGLPVAAGIGINSAERAREAAAASDAVIVGTALVEQIHHHPDRPAAALGEFTAQLRAALHDARAGTSRAA